MYKVLLVDDENIIIESISRLIDWEKFGLKLVGSAQNGLEAYARIKEYHPHIVITDIKMPGMNGLDLMKTVKEELPDTVFVILSGYGEFDFASKAIQYGVKHYLLKPCDEDEIVPVLVKIIDELKIAEKKESFFKGMEESLKKVIPQVKEQFLRDFIINKVYRPKDCTFFLNLFHISNDEFKLVLLKPEKECDYIEKFALKNISEEIMLNYEINVYLSTVIEENVPLLIQSKDNSDLIKALEEIKENYFNYYGISLTAAISKSNSFDKIPDMYIETQECLQYAFYLGDGNIIPREDVLLNEDRNYSLNYDFNKLAIAVKTGSMETVQNELDMFFDKIGMKKMDTNLAKSYCTELYQIVVRQCRHEEMDSYMKKMSVIPNLDTLKQIAAFIRDITLKITHENYASTAQKYSTIIKKTIECITANIKNPDLSLNWIAREVLFMNENYLGRLFFKETNQKFSQYVMKVRIEKAKELLDSSIEYKVYEICELIGFADPQYFSQVFKKHTGFTPSEYSKAAKAETPSKPILP